MASDRTKLVMGIILIFLMVSSLAGILAGGFGGPNPNESEYNGFTVTQTPQGFQIPVNDNPFLFLFHPADIDFIEVPFDFQDWTFVDRVYVSSDPEEQISQAFQEFHRFRQVYGISAAATPACPEDSEACELNNFPVRTCDDASDTTGVIVMKESNGSSISYDANCLIIEGSLIDAARYFDRVAMQRVGIIQ